MRKDDSFRKLQTHSFQKSVILSQYIVDYKDRLLHESNVVLYLQVPLCEYMTSILMYTISFLNLKQF